MVTASAGAATHAAKMRDQRLAVRVGARGRVVILGDTFGRGKIVDLSHMGVRFRVAGPVAGYHADDRVDLELRFDGPKADWWTVSGRIVRLDGRSEIAVAFDDVPADFRQWIRSEVLPVPEVQLRRMEAR